MLSRNVKFTSELTTTCQYARTRDSTEKMVKFFPSGEYSPNHDDWTYVENPNYGRSWCEEFTSRPWKTFPDDREFSDLHGGHIIFTGGFRNVHVSHAEFATGFKKVFLPTNQEIFLCSNLLDPPQKKWDNQQWRPTHFIGIIAKKLGILGDMRIHQQQIKKRFCCIMKIIENYKN